MTQEVLDILKGHINEVFDNEGELSKERLKICEMCPLYKKTAIGYICDKYKWLNQETNEVLDYPQIGWENGCGCRLAAKTRVSDAHCPLNKW